MFEIKFYRRFNLEKIDSFKILNEHDEILPNSNALQFFVVELQFIVKL